MSKNFIKIGEIVFSETPGRGEKFQEKCLKCLIFLLENINFFNLPLFSNSGAIKDHFFEQVDRQVFSSREAIPASFAHLTYAALSDLCYNCGSMS